MHFMLKLAIAGCFLLPCSIALADLVDSNGVTYKVSQNKHGIMLKSPALTLYLGKTCDADSSKYGKGKWGWANGGVLVTLKQKTIGFPRQESPFADNRCAK